jgi:20S proteasome alpha/beta subunit
VTAVLAIASGDGAIVLAGDSFCGTDEERATCSAPKVWRVGAIGVGISGEAVPEARFSAALRSFVARGRITARAMRDRLPPVLADALRGTDPGSSYLLAHAGAIYRVEHDGGVWAVGDHFTAIGSAGREARAAIAMAAPCPPASSADALEVARRALEVAARLSAYCVPPFHAVTIEGGKGCR